MLRLMADNKQIKTNPLEFSDGALTYKLEGYTGSEKEWTITVDPSTPVYRIREEVEILTDAIMQTVPSTVSINLNLPYLPYGRADRKFEEGNGKPLENFELFLLGYDKVVVCDPHNLNSLDFALVNYDIRSQIECFKDSICRNTDYDYVVAPDKGAREKARDVAEYLGIPLLTCDKVRDLSTGNITGMKLIENVDLEGKKVLIPDDILDGGGTFIGLSQILRDKGVETVDLYITHLIGVRGLEIFEKTIDKIFCYHTIGTYLNKTDVMNFNTRK